MCSFCDDGAVSRVEMDTRKVSEEEGRCGRSRHFFILLYYVESVCIRICLGNQQSIEIEHSNIEPLIEPSDKKRFNSISIMKKVN